MERSCHGYQQASGEYIEGTICLVNGRMGAKGMVFRAWAHA